RDRRQQNQDQDDDWHLAPPFELICVQGQLLHSPVPDFAHKKLILTPAIDLIHGTELLELLSGFAEFAENFSGEIDFIDLATRIDIFRRVGIRNVHHLSRPGSDAYRRGASNAGKLRFESSVGVENLNSFIS